MHHYLGCSGKEGQRGGVADGDAVGGDAGSSGRRHDGGEHEGVNVPAHADHVSGDEGVEAGEGACRVHKGHDAGRAQGRAWRDLGGVETDRGQARHLHRGRAVVRGVGADADLSRGVVSEAHHGAAASYNACVLVPGSHLGGQVGIVREGNKGREAHCAVVNVAETARAELASAARTEADGAAILKEHARGEISRADLRHGKARV